jgi:hypothetical protein
LKRIVLLLAFALSALQATGLAAGVEVLCVERCQDDGPDGRCAPTCQDCLCCAQPRVYPLGAPAAMVPVQPVARVAWPALATPASADPGEILRVPKSGG